MNTETETQATVFLVNFATVTFSVFMAILLLVMLSDKLGWFNKKFGEVSTIYIGEFRKYASTSQMNIILRNIEITVGGETRKITESVLKIPSDIYQRHMKNRNPFARVQFMKGILSEECRFIEPAPFLGR